MDNFEQSNKITHFAERMSFNQELLNLKIEKNSLNLRVQPIKKNLKLIGLSNSPHSKFEDTESNLEPKIEIKTTKSKKESSISEGMVVANKKNRIHRYIKNKK